MAGAAATAVAASIIGLATMPTGVVDYEVMSASALVGVGGALYALWAALTGRGGRLQLCVVAGAVVIGAGCAAYVLHDDWTVFGLFEVAGSGTLAVGGGLLAAVALAVLAVGVADDVEWTVRTSAVAAGVLAVGEVVDADTGRQRSRGVVPVVGGTAR